jgi:hypothetical protein
LGSFELARLATVKTPNFIDGEVSHAMASKKGTVDFVLDEFHAVGDVSLEGFLANRTPNSYERCRSYWFWSRICHPGFGNTSTWSVSSQASIDGQQGNQVLCHLDFLFLPNSYRL